MPNGEPIRITDHSVALGGSASPGQDLRIRLFGSFSISRGDQPLPHFPTQKARNLFCYLVLHRDRFFPREVLIGTFWGDRPEDAARKSLRTAIWRIRKILECDGENQSDYLLSTNHGIGFNTATGYWLDVEEFEQLLSSSDRRANGESDRGGTDGGGIDLVDRLLELYRGELLEGVYDDWCLYEQQRLKGMLVNALERAQYQHQVNGRWHDAIRVARRLLSIDPLLEHVHRDLMRCYSAIGNRPKAIQQFEICAELLTRELRIEPMPETLALYTDIRDGTTGAMPIQPGAFPIRRPHADLTLDEKVDRALARLQAAHQSLEEARVRLARGLADVEKLLGRGDDS